MAGGVLTEIDEAQGAQLLACERELGLDRAKLNVNGGAIALGHPLAATGVRLTITVAKELQRRGARWGIASACVGGGGAGDGGVGGERGGVTPTWPDVWKATRQLAMRGPMTL